MPLGYSPKNKGTTINPQSIITRSWALWHADNPLCLRAISATVFLVKVTEKITGSSLTIFVPHTVEALLNFHPTQYFSASCLTSCEVLLLTVPHVMLLHCGNFNPVNLLQLLNADGPLPDSL